MTNFGEKREGVATKGAAEGVGEGVGVTTTSSSTSSSTSTTTTTIHTHPGVFWNDDMLEAIAKKYEDIIGYAINGTIGHYLRRCMNAGMNAYVVLDAIERTGWARKPSPYYLRAILERYLRDDILTLDDVHADERDRYIYRRQKKLEKETGWFY